MGFVKYSVTSVDVIEADKEMPGWVSEANKVTEEDKPAAVAVIIDESDEIQSRDD